MNAQASPVVLALQTHEETRTINLISLGGHANEDEDTLTLSWNS